nr:hypothetical protein [Tessaracoccus coleopterorum]
MGTDNELTGHLETSSPLVNQLQSNIIWGQRGNFLSVPTDTPARDERMGGPATSTCSPTPRTTTWTRSSS